MLLHTPPLPAACLHSIVHEGFHWPAAVHREIAGTERSGILIRTGQEVKGSFTDKARETSKARPLAPGCRALSPDRSGGAGMYEAGGRHFPTASQGRHHATTHTHKHTLAHAQQGLRKGNHSPISFFVFLYDFRFPSRHKHMSLMQALAWAARATRGCREATRENKKSRRVHGEAPAC